MYQLLNTDLQNNNNISSICSHLHVSNSYLYQCTTKVLQQSPKDLLIQYRINKAYKLLENKSLTLEKIASLLYYKNAFYFSKQFKEKTGSSPSKFRTTYYNHFK
ncbi:helix-turn-helix domain-containing protein [Holdemania filiformis]|uniref:helix-turn-helix domain-containing protein n=1 Tax=Holdemania filiformis TaxID=61171 RepID=UPI003C6DA62C